MISVRLVGWTSRSSNRCFSLVLSFSNGSTFSGTNDVDVFWDIFCDSTDGIPPLPPAHVPGYVGALCGPVTLSHKRRLQKFADSFSGGARVASSASPLGLFFLRCTRCNLWVFLFCCCRSDRWRRQGPTFCRRSTTKGSRHCKATSQRNPQPT